MLENIAHKVLPGDDTEKLTIQPEEVKLSIDEDVSSRYVPSDRDEDISSRKMRLDQMLFSPRVKNPQLPLSNNEPDGNE